MSLRKNHGFGLIEVLVALAIMAVGLLAVASFQSGLLTESADNKARAQAVAIAQERIEQIRNYSNLAYDSAGFDALFADITNGNSTEFTGTNAVFTRTETIIEPSDTKEIDVFVNWVDASGVSQQVTLSTEISWESPSLAAELDYDLSDPLVRSATGRAELGDGDVLITDKPVDELGGLLGLIDRGDGDLRLSNGEDIVLTLKDACLLDDDGNRQTDGDTEELVECTDFVKISGRMFIDQTTQTTNPTDVYVIASDAAYCQRYYFTGRDPITGEELSEDVPADIKYASISDFATEPKGSYLFYNYTCYLGGGWHGNIGLLVTAKNNSQDSVKACVGDPTSLDAFADPEIAIRRVYRGMAFKYTDDAHTQKEMNGDEIVYYTVGVADALELPDPNDDTQAPHDFVVSAIDGSDGSVCITDGIMTRDDSVSGTEFTGNPTAFYCLNQNITYVDGIKLDALGYGVEEACPFDPSDPPNQKHTISGEIYITEESTDENYLLVKSTTINTSDGPLNCTIDPFAITHDDTKYIVPYSCDVYQWTNPWSGYLQVKPDLTEFTCTQYRKNITGVEADKQQVDFNCSGKIDDGTFGQIIISGTYTSTASGVSISGSISDGVTSETDTVATCFTPTTEYDCITDNFLSTETWSGTVQVSGSKLCLNVISDPDNVVNVTLGNKSSTITITNASAANIEINIVDESTGKEKCP